MEIDSDRNKDFGAVKGTVEGNASKRDKGKGKVDHAKSPDRQVKIEPDDQSERRMDLFKANLQARFIREMSAEEDRARTRPQDGEPEVSSEMLRAAGIEPDDETILPSIEEDIQDAEEFVTEGYKRRRLHQAGCSHGRNRDRGRTQGRERGCAHAHRHHRHRSRAKGRPDSLEQSSFNFFGALSNAPELFMELAKQLRIKDFISLYTISKDFHETINGHLAHIMKTCAAYHAPSASSIFIFNLYAELCIPDPVGRMQSRNPGIIRQVPSLRWLQMVIHREKCVREILACLAREGHRTPKTMSLTLMKMWLTMDIATSARRAQFMHNNKYWTNNDLYNVQLFIFKLDMRMNDPLVGPADDALRKLMLGQRGLTPLCKLLKRTAFTDPVEIVQANIRYAYNPGAIHRGLPMFGVPPNEIGKGHLEGWGLGRVHLYRIDELLMREAVRRNMGLKKHMMSMMVWGMVDPVTKENIEPTEDETYMSEDDVVADWFKRKPRPKAASRKTRNDQNSKDCNAGVHIGGDHEDDMRDDETENEGDDEKDGEEDGNEDNMEL